MSLEIIGEPPLATDAEGKLKSRIGSVFPKARVLITLPRMNHALQRIHYTDHLDSLRKAQGLPPLSDCEKDRIWDDGVDLIMTGRDVQIRPNPDRMPLAFEADECLQEIVPKQRIRFLHAQYAKVQQAIRERGEYWRISTQPRNKDAIIKAIKDSKVALGGLPIYYYSPETGIRYLTLHAFNALAALDDEALRQHLTEIGDFSARYNRYHCSEVAFFAVDGTFGKQDFAGHDFAALSPDALRALYGDLAARFQRAVPPALHSDSPADPEWRKRMFDRLAEQQSDEQTDAMVSRLSPEFFRQIYWHPGGRIENGELVFDTIFSEYRTRPYDPELARLCDQRVKGFICNYVREFGDIEYVNIGGILPDMRQRPPVGGHRSYLAEVMYRGADRPVLRILRIQRWGIRENLDAGKDLLWAVMEAYEYTEFTLDRRLGCWELGMPLPGSIDTRTVPETYFGKQQRFHGTRIWTTYYERDFIEGLATDKITTNLYADRAFTLRVAQLLGQAAAPNLVVGRTDGKNNVTFDSGDEMILTDAAGTPQRIVVADHAGTFNDYTSPLSAFVSGYARPAVRHAGFVPDPDAFINTYLDALSGRLLEMQEECHLKRRVFDALFQHSKQGPETFSDRWARALERLEHTDVAALVDRIRAEINLAHKA